MPNPFCITLLKVVRLDGIKTFFNTISVDILSTADVQKLTFLRKIRHFFTPQDVVKLNNTFII